MEPSTIMAYCLFMLACFGPESRPPNHSGPDDICPTGCQCYSAPKTGIENNFDAESYICSSNSDLAKSNDTNFGPRPINTVVMLDGAFRNSFYGQKNVKPIETVSLVLRRFTLFGQNETSTGQKYVFELFEMQRLKYLSILETDFTHNSTNVPFDWTQFASNFPPKSLRTLYVNGSNLPSLPQSFHWICAYWPFHTVIVTDSRLAYIDREAFFECDQTVRKLVLSRNLLRTWLWLTRAHLPWSELTYLDLSSNQLVSIPADLLEHTPALKILYLAHNHFKYFSLPIIQPLLSLDELLLAAAVEGQEYDYLIYADKQMAGLQSGIYNRVHQQNEQISLPLMFLESLQNSIRYYCPLSSMVSPIIDWNDIDKCARNLNYLPDSLYLNSKSKLMRGKDEQSSLNGSKPLVLVSVEGVNLMLSDGNAFTFDRWLINTNNDRYNDARDYLFDQLDSMSWPLSVTVEGENKPNTLRIQLLSAEMFLFLLSNSSSIQKYGMIFGRIRLIIDLAEEMLDEAAARGKLIMFVLYDEAEKDNKLPNFDMPNFEVHFIEPLLTRISRHSALIGLELIGNFMGNYERPNDTDEGLCDSLNHVLPYMGQLLGLLATSFKKYSGDKLLGVSISANCEACLLYAFHPNCRELINFDDPYGLDFVSIQSKTSEAEEPYSFRNWPTKRPEWFNALTGKPESVVEGSVEKWAPLPKLGVFFLIHFEPNCGETVFLDTKKQILEFATGFFAI